MNLSFTESVRCNIDYCCWRIYWSYYWYSPTHFLFHAAMGDGYKLDEIENTFNLWSLMPELRIIAWKTLKKLDSVYAIFTLFFHFYNSIYPPFFGLPNNFPVENHLIQPNVPCLMSAECELWMFVGLSIK